MIDEKINNSLKELEDSLNNIESARRQVEKIVTSHEALSNSTTEYVNSLNNVTAKIQIIIDLIGKDYNQRINTFEIESKKAIESVKTASEKLAIASNEFSYSLTNIRKILNYNFIVTILLLIIFISSICLIFANGIKLM